MCIKESSLRAKASDKVDKFIKEKKIHLLHTIYYQICDKISLPLLDGIQNATRNNPVDWISRLQKITNQSNESFNQQKLGLEMGMKKLEHKLNGTCTNHYCLIGPPGSGKSLVSKVFC